jgi:peptide/nickel transport system substrate-binding protein
VNESYWTERNRGLSRRRLLSGAGAIGATAALAACGGNNAGKKGTTGAATPGGAATSAAAGGSPVRGGTLTVGLASTDIYNLDPLPSGAYVDRLIYYQMYDSLLSTDKDLKLNPGLALSWETSDPLNIVFHLRQGVTFHDGTPFNADAVKYNIDRIKQTPSSPRNSEIASVDSVQVVDPATVKFVLKSPTAPLLATLVDRAGMILSPAAIQKAGATLTQKPTGAGTGAFKFVDYVKSDHINLARNESYWGKDAAGGALPYLDKLTYRFLVDDAQRLNSLKTGEIDFSDGIAPKDVDAAKKDPSLTYVQIPALSWTGIELNSSTGIFKDIRVRQAFAWAIDRQQIVDSLLFKINPVATGPIAPSQFPFDPSYKPYTRDVAKAKALLQAAGNPTPSFTLIVYAGSQSDQQLGELIKDEALEAGFTVNIQALEGAAIAPLQMKHQFEALRYFWSGRQDPDGNTYNHFHTNGGFNDGLYSNPTMDKALEDARTTFDQSQRKTLYQQVNKLAAEEAPHLFIYNGVTGQASTPKVKHFTPVPDGIYRFIDVWKTA